MNGFRMISILAILILFLNKGSGTSNTKKSIPPARTPNAPMKDTSSDWTMTASHLMKTEPDYKYQANDSEAEDKELRKHSSKKRLEFK